MPHLKEFKNGANRSNGLFGGIDPYYPNTGIGRARPTPRRARRMTPTPTQTTPRRRFPPALSGPSLKSRFGRPLPPSSYQPQAPSTRPSFPGRTAFTNGFNGKRKRTY